MKNWNVSLILIAVLVLEAAVTWASNLDYELEAIFFNEESESAPSFVVINGETLYEKDQIGKYGIEKIEAEGILVTDKITGKSDYWKPEVDDPAEPPSLESLMMPLSESASDAEKEEFQRQWYRNAKKLGLFQHKEGEIPHLYQIGLMNDAAKAYAAFLGLRYEDLEKQVAIPTISNWLSTNKKGTPSFDEYHVRVAAMLREERSNCRKIKDAYKKFAKSDLGYEERKALEKCQQS